MCCVLSQKQERVQAEEAMEAERKQMEEKEALKRQLEGRKKRKRKTKERTEENKEVGFFIKNRKYLIIGIASTIVLLIAVAVIIFN